MINILPNEGKAAARGAYLLRLAIVATFAGAFIALGTGTLLLPSYVETSSAAAAAKLEAARLTTGAQSTDGEVVAPLSLAEAGVLAFRPTDPKTAPSAAIETLLSARTESIALTQIQYNDLPGPRAVITGTAATREALLLFTQGLRKIPGVSKADLPVNDLAKNENAHFTITISFATTTAGNVSPKP